MAWEVRYRDSFRQIATNQQYTVDILQDPSAGIINIPGRGNDPLAKSSFSISREEAPVVMGSEMKYNIVLPGRENLDAYAPLWESAYRTFRMQVYRGTTLIWFGWIQPEHTYYTIFEPNTHIYISATDGLKDLADFDFLDEDGNIETGRMTGLEIIEQAFLPLVGLNADNIVSINFLIKLNTRYGVTAQIFNVATFDSRRFYHIRAGRTDVDSCLTALEKLLTPFNCRLRQSQGAWKIYAHHEIYTNNQHTYPWNTMASTGEAAANDRDDITDMNYNRSADSSSLSPLRLMNIRLLNRNLGEQLEADINDYRDCPFGGAWDYTAYTHTFDTDPVMQLDAEATLAPPASNGYVTLCDVVSIAQVTTGDYLKLQFSFLHDDPGVATTDFPTMRIGVVKDGVVSWTSEIRIMGYEARYESPLNDTFKILAGTNDYNIRIEIFSQSNNDYECYFNNFWFSRVIRSDEGELFDEITFDTWYDITRVSGAGKSARESIDVYFGDSPTTGDMAAIVVAAVNTTRNWNRNIAETLNLLEIYALEYMNHRSGYYSFINIDVKDTGDVIDIGRMILLSGINYDIVSFSKSYRWSWCNLQMKQRFAYPDDPIVIIPTQLTSVDGIDLVQI